MEVVIVFDDKVHFLDALVPDDVVVLPEGGHVEVLLMHASCFINAAANAAVAVVLAFVWDVADAPSRRLITSGLFEDFEPHMYGAVAIIHRCGPVLGALGIYHVAPHIVVRLIGFRIEGVFLGEGERDIEQHELVGAGDRCAKAEQEERKEQGAVLHEANHGGGRCLVNAG